MHYDHAKRCNVSRTARWLEEAWHPRFGMIVKPGIEDTFRLGFFSSYNSFVSDNIAPPDIAGIPVFRNSALGTVTREGDVVWEHEWNRGLVSIDLFAAQSRREEKPTRDSHEMYKGRLKGVEANWNQMLCSQLGVRGRFRTRSIDNDASPDLDRKEYWTSLGLTYRNEWGVFGSCLETFRHDDFDSGEMEDEDIWITDCLVGYEFPQKRGSVSLMVENLFDDHFNWVTDEYVFSGRVPVRRVTATLSLNF